MRILTHSHILEFHTPFCAHGDHQDGCKSKKVSVAVDCVDDYSIEDEDRTEYCVGWNQQPCPQVDQLRVTSRSWYFNRAINIWGIPISGMYATYGGGGYITNLDINLMVSESGEDRLYRNV